MRVVDINVRSVLGSCGARVRRVVRRAPVLPLGVIVLLVAMAVLAPVLAPHSPTQVNLSQSFQPPVWQGGSGSHILGTDKLGRDILSRIMYGARISLAVAAVTICAAGTIGVALGMLAGYRHGWTENLIMRVVDIQISLPTVLLALMFAVVWGPSLRNLLILITLNLWASYARQAHAQTLSLSEREYVLAARTVGASDLRILRFHIMPNLINSIVVLATMQIASVVLMEASLSFLGVGLPPPTPAWGLMISDGRGVLEKAWWVSAMPGIALALLISSANFTGDWLRDYLDPTLRRSR